MNDAVLSINATLGKRGADECKGDLEAKVKASMRAVLKENFMDTTDEGQFRAGLAGAVLSVGQESDDGKRLMSSIEHMRKFSAWLTAAQAGVHADVAQILPKEGDEPLPLMKWWHDVKAS